MAENEVKIRVTTETETAPLEELDTLIDGIQEKAEITGTIDVDDTSVTEADDTTQQLSDDLDEVDGKTISPQVDSSGLEDLKASAEETSSSLDSVATAAVGIGASAGIEQMVSTADRINTSWNRLELTFEGTGVSMDALKTKSTQLSTTTGRAGGIIRDYFNQMGIAGVTNTDLLSSSFEALSGKAYQTGNSIESMESKMQTMVLSGTASKRMLKSLGLSAEDLANVMGVSADQVSEAFKNLTPEERLQAITQAMGDGAKANEMYKNSYEGLKAQADAAMAGLMGAVGQAILPVVVPALQAATQAIKFLTDGFKALPGPVQAIIGGIGGFIAISLTVVGVLGTVGQMFKMVKGGLEALNLVTKLSTIANKAAAAAQWLLNAAMSANPVMLVVIAIIALIAVLGYLYFNNEQVRAAIDGLGQTLLWIANIIWSTITGAIQWLGDQFNQFTSQLGLNTQDWMQAILSFILFLPQLPFKVGIELANALAKALGFGDNFVQGLVNSAMNAVNGFAQYIASLPQIVMDEFNRVLGLVNDFINSLPDRVWDMGAAIIDALKKSLGIGSPGYMYYMVEGEFDRIDNLTKKTSFDTEGIGQRMVHGFNPDLKVANGSINNIGAGGDTIVNIYGDVDNDRRITEIVEAVRRELAWNNKTAGRSV